MTHSKQKAVKRHRDQTTFFVNGTRHDVHGEENFLMLANWLRRQQQLTGTKIVCAEGDCGACTIQQAYPAVHGAMEFQAVNSCIKLVGQMDGASLVTVEGIQNGDELSPVQTAMRTCHGSQCGYCTPGFVMALSGVLETKKQLDAKASMNCLTGNLCRCTGYQPIIDAASSAKYSEKHSLRKRYLTKEIATDLAKISKTAFLIETSAHRVFYAPTTLKDALVFLKKRKSSKTPVRIISSSTDLGVQYNKGRPIPDVLLSLHLIPELQKIERTTRRIKVGARVTLSEIRKAVESSNPEFARLLNLFASPQIKNTATLVGNVANASPIGDTMPFLMIADALVHIARLNGTTVERRSIPLTEFYVGYKQLALKPDELITHVSFDVDNRDKGYVQKLYKTSTRKDLDISTVCGAFALTLKDSPKASPLQVAEARISLGGVAATTIRCPETEDLLKNQPLTSNLIQVAARHLADSIAPLSDLRGSADYRKVLVKNMFERFGCEILAAQDSGKSIAP